MSISPNLTGALLGWQLDALAYASSWSSGAGAQKFGGRWHPKGMPSVHARFDAATAILEVAVHKSFPVVDTVTHVIACFRLFDANDVLVVTAANIPNPAWLQPGTPSAGQQAFGAQTVCVAAEQPMQTQLELNF